MDRAIEYLQLEFFMLFRLLEGLDAPKKRPKRKTPISYPPDRAEEANTRLFGTFVSKVFQDEHFVVTKEMGVQQYTVRMMHSHPSSSLWHVDYPAFLRLMAIRPEDGGLLRIHELAAVPILLIAPDGQAGVSVYSRRRNRRHGRNTVCSWRFHEAALAALAWKRHLDTIMDIPKIEPAILGGVVEAEAMTDERPDPASSTLVNDEQRKFDLALARAQQQGTA